MNRIWAVALNTFKETVRDRVLLIIVVFGLLLLASTRVLIPLALGEQSKLVRDVGLGGISVWGVLICIIIGSSLVYKEVNQRTLYTVLTKPVRRDEFVLGKYLGLSLLVATVVALMTAVLFGAVWWVDRSPQPQLLLAAGMGGLELMVLTGISLFFSAFCAPGLAAVFTFAMFVIGHMSGDLLRLSAMSGKPALELAAKAVYYALPNLELFNIRGEVVHRIAIAPERLWFALVYGLIWCVVMAALTVLVFERKEMK